MAQNIFVFPDEDVIVAVPEKSQGNNVFVEKKPIDQTLPFTRTVINFRAYYLNKAGNKVAVTIFRPRMEIWVGYQASEEGLDLSYWDVTKSGPNKREPMNENKVTNNHKDRAGRDYIGYGHVEVKTWPDDPNVGWG